MSITVGQLKEFLKDISDDFKVDFCLGDAIGYSINRIYCVGDQVWLDSEEE